MSGSTLMLHAGAARATLDEVRNVPTPLATDTWQPVPHSVLIDGVISRLTDVGFEVTKDEHGIGKQGQIWFGVFDLAPRNAGDEYGISVGLRNSHDRSIAAAAAMGSRVFVCDNLAISGEVRFVRKHTPEILNDLPRLMDETVAKLSTLERFMHLRIAHYKESALDDRDAAHFLVRSINQGALPIQRMKATWNEWLRPTHEQFAPRNAWSLFNAFTESLKPTSFILLPQRTQQLHLLMDKFVGTPTFETLAATVKSADDIQEITVEDVEALVEDAPLN